jgi:hypothetical protein
MLTAPRMINLAGHLTVARLARSRREWLAILRSLRLSPIEGAAGLVDATEALILDHIFGGPDFTRDATLFLALSSTTPTDAGGNFTEPSTGDYARVSITNNATNFPGATAGAKSNGVEFAFPTATADWVAGANLTHFGFFTLSSGGVLRCWGALTTPKPVLNGDTARFPVGDLDITLD